MNYGALRERSLHWVIKAFKGDFNLKKSLKLFFGWQFGAGLAMVALSTAIYFVHWRVFGNLDQTMNYLVANVAFLPFEALIVTLVLQRLLSYKEKRSRLEKLNMVIGTFFSEAGSWLLAYLSDADPELASIKEMFVIKSNWTEKDFNELSNKLKAYPFVIDHNKLDILKLKGFVMSKREFLLRLIENPNLLEHESFTELLLAYFHLIEELVSRIVVSPLKESDLKHIAGDAKRVYALLVRQWVEYMKHLAANYPYLFSLAMRQNPFDENASVEIK
jgi:hypothetical protein